MHRMVFALAFLAACLPTPKDPSEVEVLTGEPGPAGADGADGATGPAGPAGTDGADGDPGAPGTNGDDGDDGAPGADGADGAPGADGNDGATGPEGPQGPAGISCWDTDENGVADIATEDINLDGVVDVGDCAGEAIGGQAGDDGISCWDANADGIGDVATEDRNSDGVVDVADCVATLQDLLADPAFASAVRSIVLDVLDNDDGDLTNDAIDVPSTATIAGLPTAAEVTAVDDRLVVVEGDYATGTDVAALEAGVAWANTDNGYATFTEDAPGQGQLALSGVNVWLQSGDGTTDTMNGYGNLVLGYGENTTTKSRTGSHNLVVGAELGYDGYGGIVSGYDNAIGEAYSAVIMGEGNDALHAQSVIVGGTDNLAPAFVAGDLGEADYSVLVGGQQNTVMAPYAAVLGGSMTSVHSSGSWNTAVGGTQNTITDGAALGASVVLGGTQNEMSRSFSVLTGGNSSIMSGTSIFDVWAGASGTWDSTDAGVSYCDPDTAVCP